MLYIVVSVDADEDGYDMLAPTSNSISWRGIEEGIPLILQKLDEYVDSNGRHLKYTWFVRCDRQLENLYGKPDYLLDKFRKLWEERQAAGDEIAWHPHIYDHDFNVLKDEEQLVKDLEDCFGIFDSFRFEVNASRMGRSYCSNVVIKALTKLGLKIDSTAMPGRKRIDKLNLIDWESTPCQPYHPSKDNYRIPGKKHYNLLEIPFSMIETKATYDAKSIKRYMNLTYQHDIVKESLSEFVKENNLMVALMHPSEVVKKEEHPLLSFDIGVVKKNLDLIFSECEKVRKDVCFITISEVLALSNKGLIDIAGN